MAYDPQQDRVLQDLGRIPGTDLHASVRAYDQKDTDGNVKEGEPKLAVVKQRQNGKIRPIFRLPVAEALTLADFILEHLSEDEDEDEDDPDSDEIEVEGADTGNDGVVNTKAESTFDAVEVVF